MLVKLIEVHKPTGDRVHLDEVFINGQAVTSIRAEANTGMISEAIDLSLGRMSLLCKSQSPPATGGL